MLNKNSRKPKALNLFLPYDVYERHRKVGNLLAPGESVLDVGGQLGYLAQFSRVSKIVVANLASSVEQSDVVVKGNKLPFGNNSFWTVVAIDVLEHIPKVDRAQFIKEVVRVAQDSVILSFPIGTPKHIVYEKQLMTELAKKGEDQTYLKEHVKYGLPTPGEIAKLTRSFDAKLTYSGNLRVAAILFKIHLFDPKLPLIRKFVYCAKLLFNFVTNPPLYLLLSNKIFSHNVVRAYLVIEKRELISAKL